MSINFGYFDESLQAMPSNKAVFALINPLVKEEP